MALSTEEHNLLVETCTNMNVAANTCRDVLEMLRNLGNTGVVDIATHNNDTSAHPNGFGTIHLAGLNIGNALSATSSILGMSHPLTILTASNRADLCINSSANLGCKIQFSKFSEYGNSPTHYYGYGGQLSAIVSRIYDDVSSEFVDSSVIVALCGSRTDEYETWHVFREGTASQKIGTNIFVVSPYAAMPAGNGTITLGDSTHRFSGCYLSSSPDVSSDRRIKSDIATLDNAAVNFIKALRPASFKMKEARFIASGNAENNIEVVGEYEQGARTHWGFIAQEVKEALSSAGYEDVAVWCLENKNDPDSRQALRYEELIAPLIKTVQVLAAKVEALEAM